MTCRSAPKRQLNQLESWKENRWVIYFAWFTAELIVKEGHEASYTRPHNSVTQYYCHKILLSHTLDVLGPPVCVERCWDFPHQWIWTGVLIANIFQNNDTHDYIFILLFPTHVTQLWQSFIAGPAANGDISETLNKKNVSQSLVEVCILCDFEPHAGIELTRPRPKRPAES